jgi:hypothetical protein
MGLVAKAFQDIITFSRATAGTYVNSNGYITNSSVLNYLTYSNAPDNAAWTKSNSFVQTNVFVYSQEFDNANWSPSGVPTPTANTTIAPDGTLTADTVIASATTAPHLVTQATASLTATPITISIYAKANTHNFLQIFHGALATNYANFNISTGVVGTVGAGFTSASIASVGNGWFRCMVTLTPTAFSNARFALVTSNTAVYNESWAAAGTESVYLWGAQCVQGSVPGNYQATTSAALPVLYADYNGVVRARKLCENASSATHTISQTVTATAGAPVAYSVYLKKGERSTAIVYTSAGQGKYFDLNAGTVGADFTAAPLSASISSVGNGWYRCTIVVAAIASTICYVYTSDGGAFYLGDGSSGIYIADAQVNDGSSATAYYDTTASAYNAPRFDYDPVTLAAKGLLIEEQRANLLTYSAQFDDVAWSKTRCTVTANATASPDGTTNADALVEDTTPSATHPISAAVTVTAAAQTLSFFLKASGRTWAQINLTGTANAFANFNLSNGTLGTVGAAATAAIVAFGNGWYRCSITATTAAGANTAALYPASADNVISFTGSGASSLFLYGAQLEAGAFATSYMPTTGSQFTRAADVASVNTLSPWFNAVAGTLYVESIANAASPSNQYLATLNDGTTNNRVTLFKATGGTANSRVTAAGVASNPTAPATTIAGITSKVALTFSTAASGVNIYVNGTAGTAVTAAATPAGMLRLGLGLDETASTSFLNGHLRRITFYPRQMTSGEGTALTTL